MVQSWSNPQSPRQRMIARLSAALAEALRVGDLGAARVAHDALGRLLEGDKGPAEVVELATRRARRGRP
jgi:hypothetical protein